MTTPVIATTSNSLLPEPKKSTSWLSRSRSKGKASLKILTGSNHSTVISPVNIEGDKVDKIDWKGKGKEKDIVEINSAVSTSSITTPRVIRGSVKDDWPLYSCRPEDFVIGQPIGYGSSSIVYLSEYRPVGSNLTPIQCAVKVIDVDRLSSAGDIDRLRRETQLMSLSKHPNILRVRGEWVQGQELFIAVRYMSPGSISDIARYAFSDGFEETVIATVLIQAAKGLAYLHQNHWLHRDVKAGNLLVDDDGTILIADFGVSSSLFQDASSPNPKESKLEDGIMKGRKSFVGTPAYIAPEIIENREYDSKADIWSFGITALELSLGRAPNYLFAPAKLLSKTVLDASPTVDREGGKYKYSKAFKDMVDSCLHKDPKKRPTAEKLLQHPFFKLAKKPSYLMTTILVDLPPLVHRQDRHRIAAGSPGHSEASWDFGTFTTSNISGTTPTTPSGDPFSTFSSYSILRDRKSRVSLSNGSGSVTHSRGVSFAEPSSNLDSPTKVSRLEERKEDKLKEEHEEEE